MFSFFCIYQMNRESSIDGKYAELIAFCYKRIFVIYNQRESNSSVSLLQKIFKKKKIRIVLDDLAKICGTVTKFRTIISTCTRKLTQDKRLPNCIQEKFLCAFFSTDNCHTLKVQLLKILQITQGQININNFKVNSRVICYGCQQHQRFDRQSGIFFNRFGL